MRSRWIEKSKLIRDNLHNFHGQVFWTLVDMHTGHVQWIRPLGNSAKHGGKSAFRWRFSRGALAGNFSSSWCAYICCNIFTRLVAFKLPKILKTFSNDPSLLHSHLSSTVKHTKKTRDWKLETWNFWHFPENRCIVAYGIYRARNSSAAWSSNWVAADYPYFFKGASQEAWWRV